MLRISEAADGDILLKKVELSAPEKALPEPSLYLGSRVGMPLLPLPTGFEPCEPCVRFDDDALLDGLLGLGADVEGAAASDNGQEEHERERE